MYEYRVANILRVVDGDTVDVRVDLGFGVSAAIRVRLKDIDTPEIFGANTDLAAGRAAKDFTQNWLYERIMSGRLRLQTFKGSSNPVGIGDGAFGRWLGIFTDADGQSLADALRAAGHEKAV